MKSPRMTLGENGGLASLRSGVLGRPVLRQPQHLQRARPVAAAGKKAAFLQSRNQPVDAGLRLELSASFISSKLGEKPVCLRCGR